MKTKIKQIKKQRMFNDTLECIMNIPSIVKINSLCDNSRFGLSVNVIPYNGYGYMGSGDNITVHFDKDDYIFFLKELYDRIKQYDGDSVDSCLNQSLWYSNRFFDTSKKIDYRKGKDYKFKTNTEIKIKLHTEIGSEEMIEELVELFFNVFVLDVLHQKDDFRFDMIAR